MNVRVRMYKYCYLNLGAIYAKGLYSGQHNQCHILAAHDGKVGCNIVEYTTVFLYCDWLYFLWHGIEDNIC